MQKSLLHLGDALRKALWVAAWSNSWRSGSFSASHFCQSNNCSLRAFYNFLVSSLQSFTSNTSVKRAHKTQKNFRSCCLLLILHNSYKNCYKNNSFMNLLKAEAWDITLKTHIFITQKVPDFDLRTLMRYLIENRLKSPTGRSFFTGLRWDLGHCNSLKKNDSELRLILAGQNSTNFSSW